MPGSCRSFFLEHRQHGNCGPGAVHGPVKYAGSDAGSGADDDAERLVARRFELYAFTLDERSGP